MKITASQTAIWAHLQASLSSAKLARAVYCSEWLGYLPFGAYHWIEVDDKDVSEGLAPGWSEADLQALVQAGLLRREGEWQNPQDEFECRIIYARCGPE